MIQTCGGCPRSNPKWPMANAPFYFLLLTIRSRLETRVDLHDTNLGSRPRSDSKWPMAHAQFQ